MKRILYLLLLSFTVVFVGCKDDEEDPTTRLAEKTFTTSFRVVSRTAFASGDTLFAFTAGDEISVFDVSKTNRRFTQTTASDKGEARFTGIAKEGTTYYGVYPYSDTYTQEENFLVGLRVPAVQRPVAGHFDPAAAVLIGSYSAGNINFRLANTLLRLEIRMDGIDRITLTPGEGGKRYPVGTFTYLATGLAMSSVDTTPTLTLQSASDAPIENGKSYYIGVLPDVYEKGLVLTAYDKSGRVVYRLERPNTTTIAQGKVYDFCAIGYANGSAGDGREWVDLCLPSGTRWSTANVGAATPEEAGDYFSWGMTTPFSADGWAAYPYLNTEVSAVADPVTTLWGSAWTTPTDAQWSELANPAYTQWKRVEGGNLITSLSNGQSIFLPTAGALVAPDAESPYMPTAGLYWSATPYSGSTEEASRFICAPTKGSYGSTGRAYRLWGLQLRAVLVD